MSALTKTRQAITERVPDTAQNLAARKRALERELRAAGYSRTHAKALAAERLRDQR